MACVKDKIKDDVLSAINLEDEEEQNLAKSSENKEKEDNYHIQGFSCQRAD